MNLLINDKLQHPQATPLIQMHMVVGVVISQESLFYWYADMGLDADLCL